RGGQHRTQASCHCADERLHAIEYPPSTGRITPVTNAAAGDSRNNAGPATSAGCPQRRMGVRSMMVRERDSLSCNGCVNAVAIQPGAMALQRMRSGAQAIASDLVNCATPPLLALYAGAAPLPKKLSIEATLRMLPPFRASSG